MVNSHSLPRILLFGASGQLGSELQNDLKSVGSLTALTHGDADFANPEELRAIVRQARPEILVNAAAYTSVDNAETDSDLAMTVNAESPGILAAEAEAMQACFVHYSTDYVFDGRRAQPYVEESPTNPQSSYGRSKLAGELAVMKSCSRHLIIRTSWVFGEHGSNFLKTILRRASENTSLRVVVDQIGTPTAAPMIAESTAKMLSIMASAPASDERWGVYHLTANGATNWHEFATYIVKVAAEHGAAIRVIAEDIHPVSTSEFASAAKRPAYSVLDSTKIRNTFGMSLPDWQDGVDQVLTKLLS